MQRHQPAAESGGHDATSVASGMGPGERLADLQDAISQSPRMRAQRRILQSYPGVQVPPALHQHDAGALPLQRREVSMTASPSGPEPAPRAVNRTGMSDQLKAGVEALSGMDLSSVRVHRDSPKPAQLNAAAYAQGNDIHLAPGQERHLPHEAWHLVQQRQGRVKATTQIAGVAVNDNTGLEREADVMGAKAETGTAQLMPARSGPPTGTFVPASALPAQLGKDDEQSKEFGYYGRDGKRKNRRVIDMETFGDRNRIHRLDPDKIREFLTGEDDKERMGLTFSKEDEKPKKKPESNGDVDKKVGIWRPSKKEGSARPEDPPLYQPFRVAFHEAHNIKLALERDWAGYRDADRAPEGGFDAKLENFAKKVKEHSLDYKAKVRTFSEQRSVTQLQDEYFAQLKLVTDDVVKFGKLLLALAEPQGGGRLATLGAQHRAAARSKEGEQIWRDRWWASVQAVNERLGALWNEYKPRISDWMAQKRGQGLSYMNPKMLGDLDYIGSLAKGYKSAPKQYIRFMPEKFDIDANLDAPPLAVYAISIGAQVDRGSVRGYGIRPITDFESAVNHVMAGLNPENGQPSGEGEIVGVDKGDPFAVFIRASNVADTELGGQEDVTFARQQVGLNNRLQAVTDRIWWLRGRNKALSDELGILLHEAEYLTPGGTMKKHVAADIENPQASERSYSDNDLIILEGALSDFEARASALEQQGGDPPGPGSGHDPRPGPGSGSGSGGSGPGPDHRPGPGPGPGPGSDHDHGRGPVGNPDADADRAPDLGSSSGSSLQNLLLAVEMTSDPLAPTREAKPVERSQFGRWLDQENGGISIDWNQPKGRRRVSDSRRRRDKEARGSRDERRSRDERPSSGERRSRGERRSGDERRSRGEPASQDERRHRESSRVRRSRSTTSTGQGRHKRKGDHLEPRATGQEPSEVTSSSKEWDPHKKTKR